MNGQRIGYIRVSILDQNPERQQEQIPVDKIFADKASGKDIHRPELKALLAFVREGDTIVVHSMDRLARRCDFQVGCSLGPNPERLKVTKPKPSEKGYPSEQSQE